MACSIDEAQRMATVVAGVCEAHGAVNSAPLLTNRSSSNMLEGLLSTFNDGCLPLGVVLLKESIPRIGA